MASRFREPLRRWGPWVVAALVLGFLFLHHPPSAIARELASADALATAPWGLLVVALGLGVMTVADWMLFRPALGASLGLFDVLRGRAGVTMLASLHYGVSVGGYGVWLARRSGAGAARSSGALAFQMLSDLCALCWFALAGAAFAGDFLPSGHRTVIAVAAGTGALGLSALLFLGGRIAPPRIRESRFAAAWREIGPGRVAASLLLRVVSVGINVGGTWGAAQAFGLDIPLSAMIAGLPVVYLVGALPLNVLGLGAVNAAWLEVFARWAPGAELLAFHILFQLLLTALVVARGLPFFSSVVRDVAAAEELTG